MIAVGKSAWDFHLHAMLPRKKSSPKKAKIQFGTRKISKGFLRQKKTFLCKIDIDELKRQKAMKSVPFLLQPTFPAGKCIEMYIINNVTLLQCQKVFYVIHKIPRSWTSLFASKKTRLFLVRLFCSTCLHVLAVTNMNNDNVVLFYSLSDDE